MEALWLWSDRFTIVLALIAAVYSVLTWTRSTRLLKSNRMAQLRRQAPITIRLTSIDPNAEPRTDALATYDLPYRPRRDQMSRVELTGILSFYYRGSRRFDSKFLTSIMEDGSLERVLAGRDLDSNDDELLTIRCDWDVFQGFVANHTDQDSDDPDDEESTGDQGKLDIRIAEQVSDEGTPYALLEVDMGGVASNERMVREVDDLIERLSLTGGPLIKINGACSIPVAMVIAHAVRTGTRRLPYSIPSYNAL